VVWPRIEDIENN